MLYLYPCVVWHYSLSRNVMLWNIYNITWNMTCVTHIWVIQDTLKSKDTKIFKTLWVCCSAEFWNTIPKIFEVSWTQAGLVSRTWNWSPSSLARPRRPGQVSVTRCFWANFHRVHLTSPHHPIRAGPLSQPATGGHQAAEWIQHPRDNICFHLIDQTDVSLKIPRRRRVRGSEVGWPGRDKRERRDNIPMCAGRRGRGGGLGRLQS